MTTHVAIAGISQPDSSSTSATKPGTAARVATTASRVLLGLVFVVMGLNGVHPFLPQPAEGSMPAAAMAMSVALFKTGYFIPMLGLTQTLAGLLLLANRYVPLALTLLAPVLVNIVAYHAFLAPQGMPLAIVVCALEIHLAIVHRRAFRGVLAARA